MKVKTTILIFFALINQTFAVAQNCEIYCTDFNLGRRYILFEGFKGLKEKEHFIAEVKSLNFFEELNNECSKQKEIQMDSINFFIVDGKEVYASLACLLITDSLNEFVVYNGEFFEFNSKFYRMNCDIYRLYLSLIPINFAYSATPKYISLEKKCKTYKDLRKFFFED
jgi:hypothetical protein